MNSTIRKTQSKRETNSKFRRIGEVYLCKAKKSIKDNFLYGGISEVNVRRQKETGPVQTLSRRDQGLTALIFVFAKDGVATVSTRFETPDKVKTATIWR